MTVFEALILGIVQGLTEFLPVSSSAHLVFVPALMKVPSNVAFDVLLHAATLLAVVGYFWKDILALIKAFFASLAHVFDGNFFSRLRQDPSKRLAWFIIIGSIPAALIGYLFKRFIESLFSSVPAVALLLVGTGILLWFSDKAGRRTKTLNSISFSDSLAIGLAQAAAVAPGISRSGATIAAGLFRGLEREAAARFSFLLSIPAILGATILHIKDISAGFHMSAGVFIAGAVAAALCGGLAIHFFLRYIRARSLRPFAVYCGLAGAAVLTLYFLKIMG